MVDIRDCYKKENVCYQVFWFFFINLNEPSHLNNIGSHVLHRRPARPHLRRRTGANDVCTPFNRDSSQLSRDFLTPKVTRSLSPGQGLSWDP